MRRIVCYQIDFSFDREHDSSKDWFPYNETDKGVNNYLTQILISSPFSISTGIFSNQNFMIYLRNNILITSISGRTNLEIGLSQIFCFFKSKIDEPLVYSSSSHEMSRDLTQWWWESHPLYILEIDITCWSPIPWLRGAGGLTLQVKYSSPYYGNCKDFTLNGPNCLGWVRVVLGIKETTSHVRLLPCCLIAAVIRLKFNVNFSTLSTSLSVS